MNKTAGAKFFILFFLVATFFTFPRNVFAIDEQTATWCTPDRAIFTQIGDAFTALDIRKTVVNMFYSAATDATTQSISGQNSSQMIGCAYWLLKDKGDSYKGLVDEIHNKCPDATGDASCTELLQLYDGQESGMLPDGRGFNRTGVSGSFIGMANFLQGAGYNEPVPVNLAYYWNDSIRKVPFASTALAADVQYGNAHFIGFILEMWKLTRNLSYGILSIIMLVVGISIMLRKKLSPQAVVTAQYALPRIVLAVILITFSYPIGAVLASFMKFLLPLTNGLIYDVAQSSGLTAIGARDVGMGLAAVLILSATLSVTGAGAVVFVATILLIVTAVILYIFIWMKAFMLYIKLIMSIIFAPFAFALGAIPGNEKSTENWFKSAISNVFGFAFSVGYAHLVLVILFIAISKGFNAEALTGPKIGSALIVLFFPVFVVYGFIQAAKVPGKINTLIMGEEKRPGGRK